MNAKPKGTYLCMEGPAFSTRAESHVYRSWGMDVIGMTNLQEAKLAREAEICYVTVAMVTDYDCWHEGHDAVTVDEIIKVLNQNADNACKVVRSAVAAMPAERACKCGRSRPRDNHRPECGSRGSQRKTGVDSWKVFRRLISRNRSSTPAWLKAPGLAGCWTP